MFDLGFQELIVIFLIALLVVGPKKLPELARTMGKWFGEIRRNLQNVKDQIETEFNEGDTPPAETADANDLPPDEEEPAENGELNGGDTPPVETADANDLPPDEEEPAKNNSGSAKKEEKA
ncbi:MAG: Sec-independent protein translocase protein TatB [Nitrospirota bacterium]|nr:Sec-independent protein translocase protein TatB [Nitrospirota bacterium]